jgi:hypothetical protein
MDRIKCTHFNLFVFVVWAMMRIPAGYAASPPPPHLARVGPNLLANPNLNELSGWFVAHGGVCDPSVSRTADGSGSARLPGGTGGWVYKLAVPVTPGKTYMLSAYMLSKGWPPGCLTR